MGHVQGDLVLRKDRRSGWVKVAIAAAGSAAFTARIAAVSGREAALFSAVLWTVMIVWLAGYVHRARIILTEREIVVKGLVVRRRRPRSHAARVVRATVVGPRGGSDDTVFVLDAHGNVLIRVYGSNYRSEDLDRLVDALGVPSSGPDDALSARELDRMHPGLVSWSERHPVLLGCAFTVALMAAIVGVLAIAVTGTR